MAAGMGSRYGGLKQIDPVGPGGETLLDYSVFDALRAGFTPGGVRHPPRHREAPSARRWGAATKASPTWPTRSRSSPTYLPGFSVPPERQKPWGTAQAVLAAESVVTSPFAAANADDFYGAHSFAGPVVVPRRGGRRERPLRDGGLPPGRHPLRARVRGAGGMRGLGRTASSATSWRFSASRRAEGGARAPDGAGGFRHFPADTPVSLNLWGFTPSVFPKLRERFAAFLAARGTDLRVRVLPARRPGRAHRPRARRGCGCSPPPTPGSA